MTMTLYNNRSEINAINKNLAYIGDLTGDLKQATSLLNPSILIEMDNGVLNYDTDVLDENNDELMYLDDAEEIDISININYTIFDGNYCYIHEFQRYYFIDNIIIQNNKLFMLQLNVDVLESFKEQFMVLDAFITRNEFQYDPMIIDNSMHYQADKEIIEFNADKGTMVNTSFVSSLDDVSNTNITISVVNEDFIPSMDGERLPGTNLPLVNTIVSACDALTYCYLTNLRNICALQEWIIEYSELNELIFSINSYPFNIPSDNNFKTLKFGDYKLKPQPIGPTRNFSEVQVSEKLDSQPKYLVVADFIINGSSFMDYEPYSQYDIFLPYLSWIHISASDLLNNRIIVYYVVNYEMGDAEVTIYDVTNDKYIYTSSCHLGIKLTFTTTNQYEISRQRASNNTNLLLGLMSGTMSVFGGLASQDAGSVLKGATGMMGSVLKYDQAESNLIGHTSCGSISSGMLGLYQPQEVKIRKTSYKSKDYDSNFFKLYGRPLYKYELLSNMHGFTTIGDIHLENVNATQTELTSIENLLKNGVIIN